MKVNNQFVNRFNRETIYKIKRLRIIRKLVIDYFQTKDLSNAVVVAPDAGSAKMAGGYAKRMNLPLAIMDKRRSDHNDKAEIFHVIGDVEGKDALIFDDEIVNAFSSWLLLIKKIAIITNNVIFI